MNRIARILPLSAVSMLLAVLPSLAFSQSLRSIGIDPSWVSGGKNATGTVHLSAKAPSAGVAETLACDQTFAQVPSSVTVPSGSRDATFTITTSAVATKGTAKITATDPSNKTASASIRVLPAFLKDLSLSPESVVGGNSSTGTLTLSANAPTGGLSVSILSNIADVQVPASVTVPAGTNSATFSITTSTVAKTEHAVLIATDMNGVHSIAGLKITAPIVVDVHELAIAPWRVVSGASVTGTIRLNGAAPAGGLTVNLTSDQTFVSVPATVTVPAGNKSATFSISTTVGSSGHAKITATDPNYKSVSSELSVLTLRIAAVVVDPSVIKGGNGATGVVLLNAAAPVGGFVVTLTSDQSALTVPASVTVPEGSLSASFSVTTTAVTSRVKVTVMATDPNSKTATTHVLVK
ncbi:MAG: hypothetical protein P4L46_23900 [Fimbriimonas sp.]|nr:hypothetical protein [Fimbriimonas sp.]